MSKLLGYMVDFFSNFFFNTVDDFLYVLASKDPVCALLAKFLSMK